MQLSQIYTVLCNDYFINALSSCHLFTITTYLKEQQDTEAC